MIGELVVSELDGAGGIRKWSSLWCRLVASKPRDLGSDRGYRVRERQRAAKLEWGGSDADVKAARERRTPNESGLLQSDCLAGKKNAGGTPALPNAVACASARFTLGGGDAVGVDEVF